MVFQIKKIITKGNILVFLEFTVIESDFNLI